MDTIQEINNVIAEIEGWTNGDLDALKQSNGNGFGAGEVPFDGTFVFAARQKKINNLKELVKKLKK